MKIVEKRYLQTFNNKVIFIRLDIEDVSETLKNILETLANFSWLEKFDTEFEKKAFSSRANKTVKDITNKFKQCHDDNITAEAGEYVVSELARETLVRELKYTDIPLGELLGKKISGNAGFDFHSENLKAHIIIFGEAKYNAKNTAYSSALSQVVEFISDNKDVEDLPDLKPYCNEKSLDKANKGEKGFSIAFSARTTNSNTIINNIIHRDDFKTLLKYEEIILVAVNLWVP